MARPRPWPALPGHPGPAPPRRPELPPPSSQPAGPPGCAVRLRGLSPPPPWAGPAATRSHWSARRGLGARGRGYARPRPPGADSDGGSRGSAAGVARVRAGPGLGSPIGWGEASSARPPRKAGARRGHRARDGGDAHAPGARAPAAGRGANSGRGEREPPARERTGSHGVTPEAPELWRPGPGPEDTPPSGGRGGSKGAGNYAGSPGSGHLPGAHLPPLAQSWPAAFVLSAVSGGVCDAPTCPGRPSPAPGPRDYRAA
ncbi:uncharacterized protein AAEQ78_014911 [Lycaon pictus]